jgi:lipopolysaccharide transport system ATP-binding protein
MLMLDAPARVVPEYQRLLYASPQDAARLRGELRAGRERASSSARLPDARAAFDPGLRSASVVEFPARGARIANPRITTPSGEPVNVLARGGEYVLRYEVEFTDAARRARFGMMIKTISGIELGGSVHPDASGAQEAIEAGARVALAFAFRCQLHAGMYFLNTGVMAEVEGTDTYLHRLVDAVAFRVMPDPSRAATGYVDFAVRASMT